MPKKSKSTGSKNKEQRPSSTDDEERKRKELIQQAKELKEKIENETKKRQDFQTKKKQLQFYWDLEKEELQNKNCEYERIEGNYDKIRKDHQCEIDLIRERIKLSLDQNQKQLIQFKNESKIELYKLQEEHLIEQRKHERNTMECHQHLRQMKTSHNIFLHQLRHDHDDEMKRLHEEYKIRFNEITVDAERKVKELKDEVEIELKDKLNDLENMKDEQVKDLLDKHDEVCTENNNDFDVTRYKTNMIESIMYYVNFFLTKNKLSVIVIKELTKLRHEYNRKVHSELDRIKALKEELSAKRYKFRQTEKKLNEVKAQNKSIVDPLNEVKVEVEKLKVELEQVKSEKQIYNQRKKELKVVEDKLKDVQWRYEVLFQRYELLQNERNDIKSNLEKSMLQMKQRNNLQSLMMHKIKSECIDILKGKHECILCNSNSSKENINENQNVQKQLLHKLEYALKLLNSFGGEENELTVSHEEKKMSQKLTNINEIKAI